MEKLGVVKLERGGYAYTQLDTIIDKINDSIDGVLELNGINSGVVLEVHKEEIEALKSKDYVDNQDHLKELYNYGVYTHFEKISDTEYYFYVAGQEYLVEEVGFNEKGELEFYSTFENLEYLGDKLEEWLSNGMDK